MDELIEYIKTDEHLKTKIDKMCFTVGYAHNDKKINKKQLVEVLEKIILGEI